MTAPRTPSWPLDFDFFELLDAVTIARSRKHIQAFYDTSEIGELPGTAPAAVDSYAALPDLQGCPGFNDDLRSS
jgi:hypothetical protein